jgi:hypothetical protein
MVKGFPALPFPGLVVNSNLLGAAAETENSPLSTDASPGLEAVSLFAPAMFRIRLLNVERPVASVG